MCSWGYFSVSETPLLALAPLAIFIIADQLEILFFLIDKNSPAISFSTISVEARRKSKNNPICCRKLCRGRPDWTHWDCRISAHSGIAAWSSPWPFSCGYFHGEQGAELETSASIIRDLPRSNLNKNKSLPVSPSSQVLGSQRLCGHEGQKSNS